MLLNLLNANCGISHSPTSLVYESRDNPPQWLMARKLFLTYSNRTQRAKRR